jgi:hypothetical protein
MAAGSTRIAADSGCARIRVLSSALGLARAVHGMTNPARRRRRGERVAP